MEWLLFRHLGKFAFRDECLGRAVRRNGGRLRQFGWVRKLTRSAVALAPMEIGPDYPLKNQLTRRAPADPRCRGRFVQTPAILRHATQ